jgi:GH24 family phage-related lysozyme (muramidase)
VHNDSRAAESAKAVNALAYTVGNNIAFDGGQYAPMTTSGKELLAHELAHVMQQKQSSLGLSPAMEIPLEKWANEASKKVQQGQSIVNVGGKGSAGASLQRAPKNCERFYGPPNQPDTVSQQIIDRWMGKYAKEGDPGEGCREEPYVAGKTEKVCTYGYGIQIPGCMVLSRATGLPPTAEEISQVRDFEPLEFYCQCAEDEEVRTDCKGGKAEAKLRQRASWAVEEVHKVVPVNLTQSEFDALVDITLHVGHTPENLVEALELYWCTDEGMDRVREVYLNTALTRPESRKIEPGFVSRRRHRVWQRRLTPVHERKDVPVDLWKMSRKGLSEAERLQGDINASEESKRAALDLLWKAVGSIEQRQKSGFRNDEERITVLGLKRQLLQMIGQYMDAMSRGAL